MSFVGSGARFDETTFRRRYAVAIAHGREFRICRRFNKLRSHRQSCPPKSGTVTHAIRYSIEFSTGLLGKDFRKVDRPGVRAGAAAGIPTLEVVVCLRRVVLKTQYLMCGFYTHKTVRHWLGLWRRKECGVEPGGASSSVLTVLRFLVLEIA